MPNDSNRDLYIDLMERCILGLIYEDPAQDPWSPHVFDLAKRTRGLDWPLRAHSMIGKLRMDNLKAATEHVISTNIPGDFIETGAWRGGACIFMRSILKAYAITDRIVWVADSFKGITPSRSLPSHLKRFKETSLNTGCLMNRSGSWWAGSKKLSQPHL